MRRAPVSTKRTPSSAPGSSCSCIYYQSASREKINKEHNEILRLVLDDNFEAAQKLMRAHLECDMLYAIKGYHAYKENL